MFRSLRRSAFPKRWPSVEPRAGRPVAVSASRIGFGQRLAPPIALLAVSARTAAKHGVLATIIDGTALIRAPEARDALGWPDHDGLPTGVGPTELRLAPPYGQSPFIRP